MKSTLDNYQNVYEMLEDDKSKSIYLNRLNYLISFESKYIKSVTPPQLSYSVFIEDILFQIPADGKIVLYGAGEYPKQNIKSWKNDPRIIGFCSNNKLKQKFGYLGYPVMSPEKLIEQDEYYVIISTYNLTSKAEILDRLIQANYPQEKYFYFGDLAVEMEKYFPKDIIRLEENEVFIDAGSHNLETSLELKNRCPNLKKVLAFEPDPENYKQCIQKKEQTSFNEAEIFPFGTWSHKDTLYFSSKGMGSSIKNENESLLTIDVVAIDDIISTSCKTPLQITYIKMDVEGAELESLKGAKDVIQRDKPKLAICIYHKPEDMVTIPLYIKEIVPGYKLYVRHHSNSIYETVLYAIP